MACEKCPASIFDANTEKNPKSDEFIKEFICEECKTAWKKNAPGIWEIKKQGNIIEDWIPNPINIAKIIVEGVKLQMKRKEVGSWK